GSEGITQAIFFPYNSPIPRSILSLDRRSREVDFKRVYLVLLKNGFRRKADVVCCLISFKHQRFISIANAIYLHRFLYIYLHFVGAGRYHFKTNLVASRNGFAIWIYMHLKRIVL